MSVLDLTHIEIGVPYTEFKHNISQCILSTLQDDWNAGVANKLYSVILVLGDWQPSCRLGRKDELVLCLALIGSAHLTNSKHTVAEH